MIVITGGAGFVGSHVVEFYSDKGQQVRVIDNRSRAELLGKGEAGLSNWEWVSSRPGVEVVAASILDSDAVFDALRDATAVVHTAAQTAVTASVVDPRTDFMVNSMGTLNVLEGLRTAAPNAPLVFCSTNKVYGDNVNRLPMRLVNDRYALEGRWSGGVDEQCPIDHCEHSPYGVSKTAADLYVQEYGRLYGLRTTVFRMSCIYGPRQWGVADQGWLAWFARALIEDVPITIYGNGRQTRDVLFVTDLVQAIERALLSGSRGEVFNIGGGPENTVSLLSAIEVLEQLVGKQADIRFDEWRPSDQIVYVSDVQKARRQLGWEPSIGPEDGIKSLVNSLISLGDG
jgi:CDP-paratose 2-epimerase